MTPAKRFKSPIDNALRGCQFGVKLDKNRGYLYWIWTQRKGSFVSGSRCLCHISSKSVKNCHRWEHGQTDRQTDTQTHKDNADDQSVPCYARAMEQIA